MINLTWQIPSCAERDSALAQLAAQGETGQTNLMALDFRVRSGTLTESAFNSTTNADQHVPVHVETTNATAADPADGKVLGVSEFGVDPFFTSCGPLKAKGAESGELGFSVRAPTTSKNLFRVLRALQVICYFFVSWCVGYDTNQLPVRVVSGTTFCSRVKYLTR